MTEQQLAGTKVAGSLVDQRNFCPPKAVCPIECGIEADQGNPASEQAAVLSRRHLITGATAA